MNRNDLIIQLDLNNPTFQKCLFNLQKKDQLAVLNSFKKILQLTWKQLYNDSGFKWETIYSKSGPQGKKIIYSIQISLACRALVYREDNFLRFLTLHPDHDSAYKI